MVAKLFAIAFVAVQHSRHGTQWNSLEIYFRELVLIKWIQVLSIYFIHNSNLHVLLLKLRIVTPDVIKRRF